MIALDPSQTTTVTLRNDALRPEGEQPKIVVRYLTERERLQYEAWRLEIVEAKDAETIIGNRNKCLALAVVGWKNVIGRDGRAVAFDASSVADSIAGVATSREMYELVGRIPDAIDLSEDDLKKSVSAQPSATTDSAPVATETVA